MEMRPAEVDAVIKFARIGIQTLSERVLTFTGMVASIGIFGYTLYDPTWVRVAAASAFAVLCYWPAVRLEAKKRSES